MEQKIDLTAWPRREIFQFFSGISNPFYMVTFRQEVTELYKYVKANGLSFYYALVYLCTKAINQTPAFRYAIRKSDVYLLSERMPSFTDLKKGSETFHIVTMPCEGSMETFCKEAKIRSQAQDGFIEMGSETDDLIYFSCLPWVDLTAVTNERDLSSPEARDESIPHIAWGKYTWNGDRLELGMSIEVNHRLIDGVHIGQFAERLTQLISELK